MEIQWKFRKSSSWSIFLEKFSNLFLLKSSLNPEHVQYYFSMTRYKRSAAARRRRCAPRNTGLPRSNIRRSNVFFFLFTQGFSPWECPSLHAVHERASEHGSRTFWQKPFRTWFTYTLVIKEDLYHKAAYLQCCICSKHTLFPISLTR